MTAYKRRDVHIEQTADQIDICVYPRNEYGQYLSRVGTYAVRTYNTTWSGDPERTMRRLARYMALLAASVAREVQR